MVMRRCAVLERAEAAQQFELFATEQGDVDDGLGPDQHGEQAKQEDLVERIGDLAWLARVFQVFEMTQENHRLVECGTVCRSVVHGCPPQANRRSSWIQHFMGLSRTPSPDYPVPPLGQPAIVARKGVETDMRSRGAG
jgi:hypothetical protein